jgi:hypothetical protein
MQRIKVSIEMNKIEIKKTNETKRFSEKISKIDKHLANLTKRRKKTQI